MAKNTVEIQLKAKDDASATLKRLTRSVEETGHAATQAGHAAQTAFSGFTLGGSIAATAIGVVSHSLTKLLFELAAVPSKIAGMVTGAAPLQGIQAAFEGITGGGEAMLAQLREQTGYMIADRDLMKSYNQAAMLVSKTFADDLPEAMKYLTKVSAATGDSMDYMMDSFVRGVGRLSPMILDNLKVQVDLEDANKKYAESVGKTTEQLTKQEQQIAVTNEVLRQLAENTASMPDVLGTPAQLLGAISAQFTNMKDAIGTAAMPALQSVLMLLQELEPYFKQAATWIGDLVSNWAEGFAELVARAATWGANVIESMASGISGSNAISRALRDVADEITYWLQPGSPPRLLPDLAEWGAGAIDAWLSGWTPEATAVSGFLQNLRANLKPFLEGIDLGKGIDEGGLRDVFGADAPAMRRYLRAYEAVGRAVSEVKDARDGLKEAEETGDQEAIAAAKERLGLAEEQEYSARRTFNAEERRLEQRISAEAQIARAVTETAQVEAKAAADSARLADEAKQRAIEQAHLQYRLAVAGTPLGQIAIWEEELAKAEEGSAEYWQIMTRLVELRRAAAKGEGGEIGGAMGEGIADGLDEGVTDSVKKAGGGLKTKIDWAGIGEAIASALWQAFLDYTETIPGKFLAWSEGFREWCSSGPVNLTMDALGQDIGVWLGQGLAKFLGLPETSQDISDNVSATMNKAVENIAAGVIELGISVGRGFIRGITIGMTGATPEANVEAAIRAVTPEIREREEGEDNRSWWERIMREYGEWWGTLPDWLSGYAFGGPPGYAEGGIVTQPTLAWIGEQGPEAVVPLNGPGGGIGDTYYIEIPIDARGSNAREVERGVLAGLRAAGIPVNN